jgi:hypothetical protein
MRTVLFLVALAALPAFAQPAPPACDGDIAVVRISEIKPAGSVQGFMAAVAAHKAWYRAHGITNNDVFAVRVVDEQDPTTYSNKVVLTYHINPPTAPVSRDEAYENYVKLYRDNSEIKTTYVTCMPKLLRK